MFEFDRRYHAMFSVFLFETINCRISDGLRREPRDCVFVCVRLWQLPEGKTKIFGTVTVDGRLYFIGEGLFAISFVAQRGQKLLAAGSTKVTIRACTQLAITQQS